MHAGWSSIRLNEGSNKKLVAFLKSVGAGLSLVCCLVSRGSTGGFRFLQDFFDVVLQPGDSGCHIELFLSSPHL